jgi:hypothetical protein
VCFCSARCSGFHDGFADSNEEKLPKKTLSLVKKTVGGDDFDDDVLSRDKDFYTKLF